MRLFILVAILSVNSAHADELSSALQSMCENIKRCSLAELDNTPNITADMKKMMESTFEQSCRSIKSNYKQGLASHPEHYEQALACVRSMADASCANLLNSDQSSDECKHYEEATK